jgi:hypothetical protein
MDAPPVRVGACRGGSGLAAVCVAVGAGRIG